MFHVYCMCAGSYTEQSMLWPSQIKTVYLSISRHHTLLWRKPIIRLSHRFDLQFADIAGLQQCYRWPFRVWVSRWMHLKSCCSLLLGGKKALLWKGCQSIDSNNSSPQLLLYFNMAYQNTFRHRVNWSYTLLPSSSSHVKCQGGRPLKFHLKLASFKNDRRFDKFLNIITDFPQCEFNNIIGYCSQSLQLVTF